jgi:hypothetical protein
LSVSPLFGAEGFDNTVAGKRLGRNVRDLRQCLLAASRGSAHPLPEPHKRVHDQRCPCQADHCQARVVIEQQHREANQGERLARKIAECLRDRLLNLRDVVGNARHQLAARLRGKERGRLPENVGEEQIADVADDSLSDVRHQVTGQVRPNPFDQVKTENRGNDLPEFLVARQHTVENRLDQRGDARRRGAVHDHGGRRGRKPAAIRPGVGESTEGRHSLAESISQQHPQRDNPVAPPDLLPFVVAAAVVGDGNLVNAVAPLEDLRRELGLDANPLECSVIDRSTSVRITL